MQALERPFVHYVGNDPKAAEKHFHGLREALPTLRGVALFDHLELAVPDNPHLKHLVWTRREIENYFCTKATLRAYAHGPTKETEAMPLFAPTEAAGRIEAMTAAIEQVATALQTLGKGSPWDPTIKASDDFLDPLFRAYFEKLGLPNLMAKKNFHELADYIPEDEIDPEVDEKLDAIAAVMSAATPPGDAD